MQAYLQLRLLKILRQRRNQLLQTQNAIRITNEPLKDSGAMEDNDQLDLNNDGNVTTTEERIYEQKAVNRRRMAWVALVALIISGFCMMFLIPEHRIKQLDGMLELYWIALGTITGAYVGISTWMSKK
jgi:hypothetical protein